MQPSDNGNFPFGFHLREQRTDPAQCLHRMNHVRTGHPVNKFMIMRRPVLTGRRLRRTDRRLDTRQ